MCSLIVWRHDQDGRNFIATVGPNEHLHIHSSYYYDILHFTLILITSRNLDEKANKVAAEIALNIGSVKIVMLVKVSNNSNLEL